jgi:predicted N-formylglutamate amidohydrolase
MGYDPGTLELARRLSSSFDCQLFYSTVTRLLVDLNRSPDNPRRFSELARNMNAEERERIVTRYYLPYREAVRGAVNKCVRDEAKVLHISVHSFVPLYRGRPRKVDIGLLYDPKRRREKEFCSEWQNALIAANSTLRIRRNYPYQGTSDGLTSYLRRMFREDDYMGVEIEVNQNYPAGARNAWQGLLRDITLSLRMVPRSPA